MPNKFLTAASQYGQAAGDPIAQAINVYSTLSRISGDKEDRELRREEMDIRRGAASRAAATHEQAMESGALDIQSKQAAIDYTAGARTRETQGRKMMGVLAKLKNGIDLSDDELAQYFGNENKGSIDLHRQEPRQKFERAVSNIEGLTDKLGQLAEEGQITGPMSITRNDGNAELFQSIERFSVERDKGQTNTYTVLDTNTGEAVERQGRVQNVQSVLYDPQTDQVGISMGVVDADTGEMLLNMDGSPLQVPATEGRSGDPNDQIRMIDRAMMGDAARASRESNAEALKHLETRSPLRREKIMLTAMVANGGPQAEYAMKELERVNYAVSMEGAYQSVIDSGEGDEADIRAAQVAVGILKSGGTAEEAQAAAAISSAPLAKKVAKATKKAAGELKQTRAMDLQRLKNKGALAVKKAGSGKSDVPKDIQRAYTALTKAKDRYVTERGKLEKQYESLNADPVKKRGLRREDGSVKTKAEFVAESGNMTDLAAELTKWEGKITAAGYDPYSLARIPKKTEAEIMGSPASTASDVRHRGGSAINLPQGAGNAKVGGNRPSLDQYDL